MDEILASIRRIISDDMAPSGPPAAEPPAADEADVLILTERAPPEPWAFDPPPGDAPAAETPGAAEPAAAQSENVQAVAISDTANHADLAPALVAEPEARAAASFERLYFVVENTPPPAPLAISASGPTLEDLTRELLKPMVKAWLDENLDAIIRARVDAEVERISRGRVR